VLIITRKAGEAFTITAPDGTEIVVRVLASTDDVRIGIDAPSDHKILRDNAKATTKTAS
jgi:carbon storage regulator CsrA